MDDKKQIVKFTVEREAHRTFGRFPARKATPEAEAAQAHASKQAGVKESTPPAKDGSDDRAS